MKTESAPSTADAIWTNNVDLLPDEPCLPVIGSCQVSSILSNLDASNFKIENEPGSSDLIVLENHDLGLYHAASTANNYVSLKTVEASTSKNVEKNDLKNGASNYANMKYFLCQLCPFFCIKNSKITEHIANAHKTKTVRKLTNLKCPACVNVFSHKMSLRSHLIHDHGIGNSDLSQIIQAVVYSATKEKVKEQKNKIKNIARKLSEKTDNKQDTNNFQVEMKPVSLSKTEINQNSMSPVVSHPNPVSKLINSKSLHRCTFVSCKIQFQSIENLEYHMSCHKESGFACIVCNETFHFWKPLASHLWRLHHVNMELYSCDTCDYKSVSLAKLNNIHKLIHGNVKAYVCDVCKKAFKNSKQLGNHKVTHKSDYERVRFKCETCMKNFSNRRQLTIHMDVVHEKIRPFLCNYCGYRGSSRSALKMHVRQHTGEKPFACGLCSYTTSDHNSLRRHKLRHTGQRPYKCSYCSYACIQSSTYKVHLKTKHPGQEKDLMFTCNDCQFRSVNKEMYISHLITVHNQKPQS